MIALVEWIAVAVALLLLIPLFVVWLAAVLIIDRVKYVANRRLARKEDL